MNLFKKYYPVAKRELRNYKQDVELSPAPAPSPDAAQTGGGGKLDNIINALKWKQLICKYLEMCNDEEKKFIDLLYFKNHPILEVGLIFPLGMRTCQEWREEILKNILLMAAGESLL